MGCHVVLPEHCLLPESFLKEKHIFIHAILADDATAGSTTVQIELLALFHEDVIVTYVLGSKHGVSSVSSMRCMVLLPVTEITIIGISEWIDEHPPNMGIRSKLCPTGICCCVQYEF